MEKMGDFLVVENLGKQYGDLQALWGVDLRVERGEWVSVMGPSGSGKTTLLNLIGGLVRPTEGSVRIEGMEIGSLKEKRLARFRRERLGLIFQQHHLVAYLTALENVMLAQFLHSLPDEEEAREAMGRVGLGHRLHCLPSQLSGGEQQRVCIARALINSPSLLLADEPTGSLDRERAATVLKTLNQLHREDSFTILLVTHDPWVAGWGEWILTLEGGRVARNEVAGAWSPEGKRC